MTILSLFSDILLLAGTIGLAVYCRVLTGRLKAFNDIDSGLGGTIAELSRQVDEVRIALEAAMRTGESRGAEIDAACERADDRIGQLEMLVAAAEDVTAGDATLVPEEAAVTFRPTRHRASEMAP